jgi:hypothetical protein
MKFIFLSNNWYYEEVIEHSMKLNKADAKLLEKETAREHKVKTMAEKKKSTTKGSTNVVYDTPIIGEDDRSEFQLNPGTPGYDTGNIEGRDYEGLIEGADREGGEESEVLNDADVDMMKNVEFVDETMDLDGSLKNKIGSCGSARPNRPRNRDQRT